MTETAMWKMVVDERGVTISSDHFQLTADRARMGEVDLDSDPLADAAFDMEGVLNDLQTVTRGTYGQYCGLARALEVIGERWSMLIIRDLFVSPKSKAEIRQGLPRIPERILTARIKELERTGVIRCRALDATENTGSDSLDDLVVYELTPFGSQLEDAMKLLSRWGAQMLDRPRPEDIVTPDSLVMALRTMFGEEAARGLHAGYELRIGDIVIHARIDDGKLRAGKGPLPGADLIIEPGTTLRALMAGELTPQEAIESGELRLVGDPGLMDRFVDVFRFRPATL
ncbi:winged helix-turn-helix transcriptional regulator [Thermostaphylospora chromogena]|uniref:DNA-binding transcriptional regulator, HxlR family n=1 Tax=Thermostaphylospora chromogena TaxID=35622 RepID=A0A1H0ZTV1_9ACTN|nr:winged helix-turn-helix transcriptional regulator [Thermostaphylospora chromogena]SDQ30691.1 DNA-binding transcriptional regulator, HxlR family [Thermostaphylospora chromogena]